MAASEQRQAVNRRGLIAGAAALVAGIIARRGAAPVAAGVDGDLVLGGDNVINATTSLTIPPAAASGFLAGDGLVVTGQDGHIGLRGQSLGNGTGVSGRTGTGSGVSGIALGNPNDTGGYGMFAGNYNSSGTGIWAFGNDPNASTGVNAQAGLIGVNAQANIYGVYSSANTCGVYGSSAANGVIGTNSNNSTGIGVSGLGGKYGVYGFSSTVDGGTGVFGESINAVAGVFGQSTDGNGIGVYGTTPGKGIGVYGKSATGYGIVGYSSGGSASLAGISDHANVPAFAGGNSQPGGLAARFSGTVYVDCTTAAGGQFVVNPVTAKSGLLKHPDGSHRLMYTVEAPESWVEDFGTGNLVGGKADVKLDPDFAALIHTEGYHVFLTETGGTHLHLSVATTSASGFTVTADDEIAKLKGKQASTLAGAFSWRVVAKPKVDNHTATRLAKFAVPTTTLPDPSVLPKASEPPKKPMLPPVPPLPTPPPPR